MTTRRTARVNRAIQEAVSTAVLFKVKDPRVKNVTVLRAEATDDLRQAKVYVTVMGDEKRQALTMNGLAAARGFLQSKVADRLQTKQTPILTFVLDQQVKQNAAAQAALAHLFPVPEPGDLDDDEADDLESAGPESPDYEYEDSDGEVEEDEDEDEDLDDEDVDDDELDDEDLDDLEDLGLDVVDVRDQAVDQHDINTLASGRVQGGETGSEFEVGNSGDVDVGKIDGKVESDTHVTAEGDPHEGHVDGVSGLDIKTNKGQTEI